MPRQGPEILLSERAHAVVDELVDAECVGHLRLKGFREPLAAYNVVALRGMPAAPAP